MKPFLFSTMMLSCLLINAQQFRLEQTVIEKVDNSKPGTWVLTLTKPTSLQGEELTGMVVGKYNPTDLTRNQLLGFSKVTTTGNNISATISSYETIKEGDYVIVFGAAVEKPVHAGKLNQLANNDLFLLQPDGQAYYTLIQSITSAKTWEDQVFNKMLLDVRKVVPTATAASLQTFLIAIERIPQLYWGRKLDLVAEYQQWVKTGAVDYSVIGLLGKAANIAEFNNLQKTHGNKFTRDYLMQVACASNILYSAYIIPAETHNSNVTAITKLLPSKLTGADLGFMHMQCGYAFYYLKQYELSSTQYALATTAYQGKDEIQYGWAITYEAETQAMAGKYSQALNTYKKASDYWKGLYKKNPSPFYLSRVIALLEGIASVTYELSQLDSYISTYLELLPLYSQADKRKERGEAFWNIGYAYGSINNQPDKSNEYYERAYQVFDSIKNVKSAVIVLCNQGLNWRAKEDYKKALELGQRAESYARANLNAEMEGYALVNIMDTYKRAGNNTKALESAHSAEKKFIEAGATERLAELNDALAELHRDMKNNSAASKAAQEALRLYKTFATDKILADAYWNAGFYSAYNSELKESTRFYEQAIEYFKDVNYKSTATLYSNIGINYRDANDSTNSYEAHRQAINMANATADTAVMISTHGKFYDSYEYFKDFKGMVQQSATTGYYHLLTKNSEKANQEYGYTIAALDSLILHKDAEKKYKEVSNLYALKGQVHGLLDDTAKKAEAIFYTGYYYKFTDESDAIRKAIQYYKQSKQIYETLPDYYNVVIYLDIQLAGIYKSQNRVDSAHYHIDQAIALGEKNEYWKNLSDAYKTKAEYLSAEKKYDGPQGALAYYEKAAEAYGKIPDIAKKLEAMKDHGTLLKELERYDESSNTFLSRLNEIDKNDKDALGDAYWDYAYALSKMPNRKKESNEYYFKASVLYKELGQYKNYVSLISNIAINYQDMGDSVTAYKTMRDLLKFVKGDKQTGIENHYYALEKFGYIYKHFGHHRQAIEVRKKSAQGYQSLNNAEKAYELYKDAGKSGEAAKLYVEAEKLYRKALDVAKGMGDKAKIASTLWDVAYNKGSYQRKSKEALPIWEEAYTAYLNAGDTANASIMRSNVGQEMWTIYDFDKAIENHNQAIDLATKGRYMTQVAFSWRKLATLYGQTKNAVKESEANKNAIATLELLNDTTELQSAYFDIAQSMSSSQEYAKADAYLTKALAIAQAKNDSINIALSYNKFASLYFINNPDKASSYYDKAEAIQRKLKEQSSLIYTISNYGSLIMEKDRARSEKYLNEAIAIAEDLKDESILAYCHSRLYDLYRSFGKPDIARKHIDQSTELYKKVGDKISVTNNYISYAYEALYDNGDFTKAQTYMAKAKVLLDSIKNPLTEAFFHNQQANIYSDQGKFDQAIAKLDMSADIYKKLKNDWGLAGAYIDYGNIYRDLGENAIALKYQGMSDSIYHSLNLEYQRLAPINNIGAVYYDQGDYPKALEYFRRSLKYMEDNKDQNTNICKLYAGIGMAYNNMTQYDEAEKWFKKGLDISERVSATRVHAEILNHAGKLKIETKKYDEAEKWLLEAKQFQLGNQLMLERTTNATHLGQLYLAKGELEKAKSEIIEAIALAEKFGKESILWEAYFRMGVYYRKSGNQKESKEYLLKSVGVVEKLRNNVVGGEDAKKLFSSDKWIMEAYEELISVLLETGETEEAMAWLQKINENNVRDKIRSMDVTFENEDKNKALAQEKELKVKLESLEKQIAAQKQSKNQNAEQLKNLESIRTIAEGDYLKFVNQQINVQPELSKYFNNTVQPSQLKGKKKSIPKDMALVSYLVGEKQLYIFVATSDTVVARIVAIPKEKIHRDVTAMINITKSHLGDFGKVELASQEAERKEIVKTSKQTDQVLKPFEDSYHYLISPIAELISNKTKLGIIATGELNYIPFQLLGKTLNNGKFSLLINQHSLFYTNSTDMLLRGAPENKDINILAFGNPDKTLPATEKEVKDIQTIFPNTKVYIREEATEDKAKYASEEFNVMHFATHGNLDYEDFSKSYLTMASSVSKNEDGMLTLEELWGMEVMSHLNIVVLSACQTAVTKGSDESSPVSPASGFLQNGVKSVIATLWKVDDEATSLLMNDFYTNIKTMDAVDAMRMAQSKLASNPKFSHPYYWGAMVLIGDWR